MLRQSRASDAQSSAVADMETVSPRPWTRRT
jgi:hypothetical protein